MKVKLSKLYASPRTSHILRFKAADISTELPANLYSVIILENCLIWCLQVADGWRVVFPRDRSITARHFSCLDMVADNLISYELWNVGAHDDAVTYELWNVGAHEDAVVSNSDAVEEVCTHRKIVILVGRFVADEWSYLDIRCGL